MLTAWNLVLFIIGFGSLIFVHELGHFLVAKWVGIKATQFAVGFGHALACYRRGIGWRVGSTEPEYQQRIHEWVREQRGQAGREDDSAEPTAQEIEDAEAALGLGETEYRLNWIPFGGYVKMVGQEDLDPTAASDNPRAFNKKPIWARMCVVSAGVVMNVIFAVLFFMVAFMVGVAFPPAIVGDVAPNSPAATAEAVNNPDVVGLQAGDHVVAINGEATTDFVDVRIASALARPGQTLNLDVRRPELDGSERELQFAITPVEDAQEQLLHIGVMPAMSLRLSRSEDWAPLLEPLGIEPGMRLVAVDGREVEGHWAYRRLFNQAGGQPLELTFSQMGRRSEEVERRTITFAPRTQLMGAEDGELHVLGLMPATRIIQVASGSPADGVLKPRDIIMRLAGVAYPGPTQMPEILGRSGREPVSVRVLRDGEQHDFEITPNRQNQFGVRLGFEESIVRGVVDDTPFGGFELPAGTRLVAVDDEPVQTLSDLRRVIQQADADQLNFEITYRMPAGGIEETRQFTLSEEDRSALANLGWTDELPFSQLEVPQRTSNPWTAIVMGVDKTHSFMIQTYITINRLIIGTVRVEHLRGPVGIVDEGTRFADRGFGYLLFFLGLISINLAVINFLPLPIVDGGLALMLIWEKLRGKPVSPQVQSALTVLGLVLIGALFLTVTFYDVARLFGVG